MSGTRAWLLWVAIALGALAYMGAGVAKLAGAAQMAQAFAYFGLSPGFMAFIGACEVAGAIGLLIRPLATWAALGLALIMVGAIVLHLRFDGIAQALAAAVLLALMSFVAWQRRGSALFTSRPVEAKALR